MKFTVQFDMDNAAFEENPKDEVLLCLARVESGVRKASFDRFESGLIRDSNGNTIGDWMVR